MGRFGRSGKGQLPALLKNAYIISVQLYSGTTGKEQACLPSISIISKTQHQPSQLMFLFCSSPLAEKRCVAQTQCCLQALMAALPVHPWQFGGLGSLSNGVTGLCFFDATQPVMLLLSTMASATALRISRDIRHSSAF